MLDTIWVVCYKLNATWALSQNCQLDDSFGETFGIIKNGSGRRKNSGNCSLEFHVNPLANFIWPVISRLLRPVIDATKISFSTFYLFSNSRCLLHVSQSDHKSLTCCIACCVISRYPLRVSQSDHESLTCCLLCVLTHSAVCSAFWPVLSFAASAEHARECASPTCWWWWGGGRFWWWQSSC